MKMRLSTPDATREAWLTAARLAAGAVLLALTVSACTGGGSSVPSTFTPTPLTSSGSDTHPVTRTPSPTGGRSSSTTSATGSPSARPATGPPPASRSTTAKASASASSAARTSASASGSAGHSAGSHHAPPPIPAVAPETGGGGTAGLQDGLLFGIGGASVLAGLGFLAMRRRLARRFAPGRPAPRDPADREPAKR